MKTMITLLSLAFSFVFYAQDLFKIGIKESGKSERLVSQSYGNKRYSTMSVGNFAVVGITVEKASDEAPRKVDPEQISLDVDGQAAKCIGRIDPRSMLLDNRFAGLSFYGSGERTEYLVFEVAATAKKATLNFLNQKTAVSLEKNWKQKIPVPELKVSSTKLEKGLKEKKSTYGPETKYEIEIQTNGSFLIVDAEITFQQEASPRASDFALIDENGVEIQAVGDLKDGAFRHNGNTGALRLREKQKGQISIVFPVGNLSIKELQEKYQLSYAGIQKAGLK